ncbi:hypothetical protein UFOVP747_33 [uncultured Caudovirales phage]|uniref:Uncharacterized protein n=1 Tax=uncultured Caudovirales phage TaxID=2100421 RepID=A0A6J7X4J5_9CAUD|nr:hypothetical protein UFOVP675_66 [uncultured Caudovirales phage]CAB5225469.1 hypothetical protein UFOVP747_33 [uncultured Caudovirales phage]
MKRKYVITIHNGAIMLGKERPKDGAAHVVLNAYAAWELAQALIRAVRGCETPEKRDA